MVGTGRTVNLPLGHNILEVGKRVKPPLGTSASHIRVPVPVPAPLFPILLPEKAVENGSSTWVADIHVGDQDGISGSWHRPGPELAVVDSWGVKQ